uniref:Uncharacterized protein n=1 Tax=Lepeophtheirus salmonis TaxID=72036 RepID=A0A0K2U2V4_LEPSM
MNPSKTSSYLTMAKFLSECTLLIQTSQKYYISTLA